MTRWLLLSAVVLAAGCEQLKSPQRISELEGKVDELTKEVATLRGKPGAHAPDEHAGSGAGGEAGAADAGAGSAETGGPDAATGAEGAGAGAAGGHEPASGAAGAVEGNGRAATADAGRDAGVTDAGKVDNHEAAAMDHLLTVVSESTGKRRPTEKEPPAGPHWAYEGKTGPPTWGTLDPAWSACLNGKAQSPVDIEPRAGTATPIAFHYQATAATLIDNGHTLQVSMAPGSWIEIDGTHFELVQLHFHTPSEHTIAGEHYPLEVHLVHREVSGKLAVVGVLYDVGAESKTLAGLWAAWPRNVGSEDRLKKPFDPSALLPETRTVFRYPGSLTTPPCTEGVVWNVMRRTLSDSAPHLELFARHYAHNAREVQPLGDRTIQ